MKQIRAKEKRLEERASKKRRVEEPSSSRTTKQNVDEEAEFLLDDSAQGDVADDNDPLSWFSKETRAMIEKVGLGGSKTKADEDEELEEDIKVSINEPDNHLILLLRCATPANVCRSFIRHERIPNLHNSYPN